MLFEEAEEIGFSPTELVHLRCSGVSRGAQHLGAVPETRRRVWAHYNGTAGKTETVTASSALSMGMLDVLQTG
jgi:hypothetical protein